MRFDSFEFALFFTLVLILHSLLHGRNRHWLLLIASYFFYASWNAPFVLLLWFSTLLDYFCANRIANTDEKRWRLSYLLVSIIGNLGVLIYFKYGNFLLDNIAFVSGLDSSPFYLDVIIPLGISFYTFQSMSYTIDVYRKEVDPCRDLLDFALYVTFFPQLIAGPILKASEFIPQLKRKDPVRDDEILQGTELVLLGLFKKVVIADNIAILVDQVFENPQLYNAGALYIAAIAFFIQIYCDFSGYSAMARGLALFFGFRLPQNFNYPLLRWNPALFRSSWHITMGNWFQNYVYRPLTPSAIKPKLTDDQKASKKWMPVSDGRLIFNLVVTWALLGFWHGASWHFILWGLINGIQLAIYVIGLRRKRWRLPDFPAKKFFGWLINFNLWIPGSILFRAEDLSEAWLMISRLYTFSGGISVAFAWYSVVVFLGAIHFLSFKFYKEDLIIRIGWFGRSALVAGMLLAISGLAATSRPFVYFQF